MQQIFNKILSYFPHNKNQWKNFLLTSAPAILSAMIFSLNAFVDNFMSTNIDGGNQALSYANTWTELEIGIISLTSVVGSIIFAQYLGKNNIKKVKEIINIRILFSIFIALLFAIPAWIIPNEMTLLISGFDNDILDSVFYKSSLYLRLITISWILNSVWYTISMILREKHHGFAPFISSTISLLTNIILNSIFIYGLNFGIEFLAYSTIISNFLGLSFCLIFIILKDREILINPLKIFIISKEIFRHFFARILSFLLLSIGSIVVTIRFVFWNIGYPTGSIGKPDYVLAAANILGITGMFFNIFWTAFESINANIAIYVGKELGANRFNIAVENAKQLQGFHTVLAIVLALLLFSLSFGVEKMEFLANGYKQSLVDYLKSLNLTQENIITISNQAISLFLSNLKFTLWPLCLFMPMFIWFITRSRVISSGGHTNVVALVESIVGTLQLIWLLIISLLLNKDNSLSFPWAYFIFFLSDIPKFVIYEIIFYKIDWVKNITPNTFNI